MKVKVGIGKALLGGVLGTLLLPTTASAAFLNDWFLDPDGPGATFGKIPVAEFLDFQGSVFVENTLIGGGPNLTFNEFGVFNTVGIDGGATGFGGMVELTGDLVATGTGTLAGDVNFNPGGTLNLWSDTTPDFGTTTSTFGADNGTNFADLTLLSGVGSIDITGVPNGIFTLIFTIDSLLPGYFFDSAMVDLTALAGNIPPLLFGFTTTNASLIANPSATLSSELQAGFTNSFGAPGGDQQLFISNNGQFRLQVPEPSALLLFGTAFIGMAWFIRRRSLQPRSP